MKNYSILIEGGGTRKDIANALFLIIQALDSNFNNQKDEDIDGAEWNDCALRTHFKEVIIRTGESDEKKFDLDFSKSKIGVLFFDEKGKQSGYIETTKKHP